MSVISPVFWFCVAGVFFVLELSVAGTFFAVLIAVAALLTGFVALATENVYLLFGSFVVFSLIGIFFGKPLLAKWFHIDRTTRASTVDALIGKEGIMTKKATAHEKGYSKIGGEEWATSSADDGTLNEGDLVVVVKIEGATAIVSKKQVGGEGE
ncbi:NfeD family protein (plasmid) [Pontibacillus sp. ALD_SL1]|uniref:NfeD family protein n=1 Tax=Pontibacillus sp. ALD_SL1 TaxID=2777185 RepID=UPI001A956D62|nr:NfeD family protein [Pontibacillus sp. ALD_SL1]QST02419.1 NfeD family protein [Pontibacillus sp. ALD_SL1]